MPDTIFDAAVFDFDGTLADLVLDFTAMKQLVARQATAFLPAVPPANGLPALEYAAKLAAAIARTDPDASRRFAALAAQGIEARKADLYSFGRLFLANPDLVEKLFAGEPLRPYARAVYDTMR